MKKSSWKLILIIVAGILAVVMLGVFGVQSSQNKAFSLEEQVKTMLNFIIGFIIGVILGVFMLLFVQSMEIEVYHCYGRICRITTAGKQRNSRISRSIWTLGRDGRCLYLSEFP